MGLFIGYICGWNFKICNPLAKEADTLWEAIYSIAPHGVRPFLNAAMELGVKGNNHPIGFSQIINNESRKILAKANWTLSFNILQLKLEAID